MKYIVVGGVAAGMSAASKIRRISKDAQIKVYEKSEYLSYGACGLSYYVAGYNDDHTKMFARSRSTFEAQGIKTFIKHEVISVDVVNKAVKILNLETGDTFFDTYDKLMIATGAYCVIPPISGVDKKGIYTLKTMEDGLLLKKAVSDYGIKNVVVVGGGYIGIEAAEAMHALNKNVMCIEAAKEILMPFDKEIVKLAKEELKQKGIEIHTEEKAIEFKGKESVNAIVTNKGEYAADMVIIAAGIKPSTKFLANTGINLENNGAIIVNRKMQTSVEDIYSAGDCATVYDMVKQKNVFLPLGTVANKCGRIAGGNMCGGSEEYVGTLSSAALKVCDLELGRTGLGENEAISFGYNVGSVTVEARNHPLYYPDSFPLTVKVIYERPSKKILGAQLCGKDGSALRTDIFAVAIHAGMTTNQLGMTDLIYSPPYAGVWDAVHIACNAAK